MKKQKPWIAFAWCVELEKAVTSYEASTLRMNQPNMLLTFQCLACRHPLILQPQRYHPLFRRHAKEDHDDCLKTIYPSKEGEAYMNKIEALNLLAIAARKLKKALRALEAVYNNAQETLKPERSAKEAFSKKKGNLNVAKEAYETFKTTLVDLEKSYLEDELAYDG